MIKKKTAGKREKRRMNSYNIVNLQFLKSLVLQSEFGFGIIIFVSFDTDPDLNGVVKK